MHFLKFVLAIIEQKFQTYVVEWKYIDLLRLSHSSKQSLDSKLWKQGLLRSRNIAKKISAIYIQLIVVKVGITMISNINYILRM